MTYRINFTDPSKKSKGGNTGFFIISDNTTNGPVAPSSDILSSESVSAETSILLYGKNVPDYGERIGENFLQMLESFSSPVPPTNPLQGQLWNKTGLSFKIVGYNNTNNNVVISGDWVSRIQEIINEPYFVPNTVDVNPYGTVRIVNVDTQVSIESRPTSVFLNGSSNTVIQFEPSTFPEQDYTSTVNYVTVASTHTQLMVYVDGTRKPHLNDPQWIQVQSIIQSDEEPEQVSPGTIWVTDEGSPEHFVAKVFLDGTFVDILTEEGGTLTGKLYYPAGFTVTDTNELVPKEYVDDAIAAVSGGTNSQIQNIEARLDDHDIRIDALETDLQTLDGNFQSYVSTTNASINTINNDITALQLSLGNKLDLAGGTLTGDLQFTITEDVESSGVLWTAASGATFDGHSFDTFSYGDTANSVVQYIHRLNAPGSDENSSLDFEYYSANDVSPSTVISFRKDAIASGVPIYEENPGLVGSSFTPSLKYQTGSDVDNTIIGLGNLLVSNGDFNWNAPTFTLSFGGTIAPTDIDLSHTHTSSDFTLTYDHSLVNSFQSLPYVDGAQLLLSPAITNLDIVKAGRDNPFLVGGRSVTEVGIVSFDTALDQVTVLSADLANLTPLIGDPLYVLSSSTAGELTVDFSGSTHGPVVGTDATGLNGGTIYDLEIRIDHRADLTFTISDDGANLTTFDDIVNAINTSVSPNATAVITGGNIVITSASAGYSSSIELNVIDMLLETDPFQDAIPPILTGTAGTDPDIVYTSTITNVVDGGTNTTITLSTDITSTLASDYGTIALSAEPEASDSLATVKLIEVMYDPRLFGWGDDASANPFNTVNDLNVSGTFAFDGSTAGLPAAFDGVSSTQTLRLPGTSATEATELAFQNEDIYIRNVTGGTPGTWQHVLTEGSPASQVAETTDGDVQTAVDNLRTADANNEVLTWMGL